MHGTCIYSYPTQCYKKALPLQANSLKANKLFLNLYGGSDGYCIVDLVSFIMFYVFVDIENDVVYGK